MQEAEVAQQLASDLVANSGIILTVIAVFAFAILAVAMILIVRSFGILNEAQQTHADIGGQGAGQFGASYGAASTGYVPKASILQRSANRPKRVRVVKQSKYIRFSA